MTKQIIGPPQYLSDGFGLVSVNDHILSDYGSGIYEVRIGFTFRGR